MPGKYEDIEMYVRNALTAPDSRPDDGEYVGLGKHFDVVGDQPPPIPMPEPYDVPDFTDDQLAEAMREGLGLDPQGPQMVLTTDSAARKAIPLFRGLVKYFPRALAAVAHHSFLANEKHNGPDAPIVWNRAKSADQMDALLRHAWDSGTIDPEFGDLHDVGLAWRALANLELKLEEQESK
jgi:hypothetical protein